MDMEHWCDGHVHVVAMEPALRSRSPEKCQLGQRMQHKLAVAVVDALRQSCGARRIEGRRLGILVKVRKVVVRRCLRKQLLVLADYRKARRLRDLAVTEDDELPDVWQLRQKRLHELDELVIDQQHR